MEVSNLLDFLKFGVAHCRISSIYGLMLKPQGGQASLMEILVLVPPVPALSLEAGMEYLFIPLWIGVEIGMDLSTPVLLIRRRVLIVHVLPNIASANISFTPIVSSVFGVSLIVGFIGRDKTETSTMV